MTSTTATRWRGVPGLLVAAVVVGLALGLAVGPAAPAVAHAQLVSTTPEEGAVLDSPPAEILLSFNEPVVSVPGGVTVFDAAGEPIGATARTRDSDLVVTLDGDVAEGTLVVAWRVVSADGHPIAGSLSFSVGAPSATVATPPNDAASLGVPVALSITRVVAYAGLLLCVGLAWYGVLVARGRPDAAAYRRTRVTAGAAAVAAVGWVVGLPLTGTYQRGVGPEQAFAAATWETLPGQEYLVTLLVSAGTLGVVVLGGRAGALVGLLAVVAPALTGHTRAAPPVPLSVLADVLHLVAGAVWLGGLVGLALTLPAASRTRPHEAATALARFSTLAGGILAALVATGAFMAWRIVGSWDGLVGTGYGRLLLVKLAVAAVAVGIAAANRFLLLPRVLAGGGVRTLHRAVSAEAAVLVAVVAVTGFLVSTSPEDPRAASGAATTDRVERTTLGDLTLLGTLTAGGTGQRTLTIQVQDAAGEPVEGSQAPVVSISSDSVDLGEVTMTPVGAGTYSGDVVLPSEGRWEVQVSLRLGDFDNPVGLLVFEV